MSKNTNIHEGLSPLGSSLVCPGVRESLIPIFFSFARNARGHPSSRGCRFVDGSNSTYAFLPGFTRLALASSQGPSSLTRRAVQVTALPLQTHACVDPLWGSLSSVLLCKYTLFYSRASRIRLCTISHANTRSLWRQSLFRPDISSMGSTTRDTPFARCICPVRRLRTWRSCACSRIRATCL